jgi:hypothetical protein
METVETREGAGSASAMPGGIRLLITLFNLAMSWFLWVGTASQMHMMTCGQGHPHTSGEIVTLVLLGVTCLTAIMAVMGSCIRTRWGQTLWRGAQLRLAIACTGSVAWGLADSVIHPPQPVEPSVGPIVAVAVGIAALSVYCAVQTRQYVR